MTMLLLHRGALSELHTMLENFRGAKETIVLVAKEKMSPQCSTYLEPIKKMVQYLKVLEGYDNTSVIEHVVYELNQVHTFNQVFAFAEFDLYRAERLKQWLGLAYIPEADLRIFRNKIAMKDHFSAHGIPTSKYAVVKSVLDVYDFADKHGFPLVVKQQEGGGGVGTKILRTYDDIKLLAHDNFRTNGYTEPSLMVETYVEGKLHHVDGVVFNGEVLYVSCGEYINGLIQDFEAGSSLGSCLVPTQSRTHHLLTELNQKVLDTANIQIPFTFHAEYFLNGDEVTLCEIACRTGGACINEANRIIRGVDINAWLLNTLYSQVPEPVMPRNMEVSGGWIVSSVGHQERTVKHISYACELPYVLSYTPKVMAGQVLVPAVSNIQGLSGAVFSAQSSQEAKNHYHAFSLWMKDNVQFIEPVSP